MLPGNADGSAIPATRCVLPSLHELRTHSPRRTLPVADGPRGQVLVVFALSLTVFLGIAALVVDFGYWLQDRRTFQNYADAAALVGANELRPPITSTKSLDAVIAAMADLDRQLHLGVVNLGSAASAASSAQGFSATTNDGYSGPDTFYIVSPPQSAPSQLSDCAVPGTGSYVGNSRAVTVRIDHQSSRFFSQLFAATSQRIGICATAASASGGYAVAVLQPPVGTDPNNTNITFNLAGANTTVNLSGGDAVSNATFAAQGNPSPLAHQTPAYIRFTTAGNILHLGIPNPNPLPWTIAPAQIQDPVGSYLAPVALQPRVTIPGWGPGPWLDGSGGTFDPNGTPIVYGGPSAPSGSAQGTCVDPLFPSVAGLRPGNYSQVKLANGQRLWLCPGVFHLVQGTTGQAALALANGGVLAGQGVTLAFEASAPMASSGGSQICLDFDQTAASQATCGAATTRDAPWTTGWSLHDVPIAIWIRPVPDCDPLAPTPCTDSSKVFQMAGGSGVVVRGILYGPTDNIVLASANTTQASSSGEVWAWTLNYLGQSTLNQVFSGPDVSYPKLVQ